MSSSNWNCLSQFRVFSWMKLNQYSELKKTKVKTSPARTGQKSSTCWSLTIVRPKKERMSAVPCHQCNCNAQERRWQRCVGHLQGHLSRNRPEKILIPKFQVATMNRMLYCTWLIVYFCTFLRYNWVKYTKITWWIVDDFGQVSRFQRRCGGSFLLFMFLC